MTGLCSFCAWCLICEVGVGCGCSVLPCVVVGVLRQVRHNPLKVLTQRQARDLRCLRASAVCVQPQPSRQPAERRRHSSGFACRRVCRQMPGCSGPTHTAYTVVGHNSSMRARMRMVQVREPKSCRRCRNSARTHAPWSRAAAAATRVWRLPRGRPGARTG